MPEYKKNQSFVVDIVDITNEGLGIGKLEDGYTVFVKDGIPGDKCQIGLTKTKKTYGFARLEKVITPSSFRVEPKCQFYKACGGCQIQPIDYKKQFSVNQVHTTIDSTVLAAVFGFFIFSELFGIIDFVCIGKDFFIDIH